MNFAVSICVFTTVLVYSVTCGEPCQVPSVSDGELGKYEEKYRRYKSSTVFKKVPAGSTLSENEELILKCNEGFVSPGQQESEISVTTCLNGELSPQPECTTTSCLGDPPSVQNGRTLVRSRENGISVWYKCDRGFAKVKSGSVKCVNGQWIGNTPLCLDTSCLADPPSIQNGRAMVLSRRNGHPVWYRCDKGFSIVKTDDVKCVNRQWIGETPVCRDMRCHKESLNYPGVIKGEGVLFPLESFQPSCSPGYYEVTKNSNPGVFCNSGKWMGNLPPCTLAGCTTEALLGYRGLIIEDHRTLEEGDWLQPICAEGFGFSNNNDSKLHCREGQWSGYLPPCIPEAHCLDNPPVPENGRIKSPPALINGSPVEYECGPFYELQGESSVICVYGKWSGSLPFCKDSRCYRRNLPLKDGIDLTDDGPVNSGEVADITCKQGYHLKDPEVLCDHGEWKTENFLSPCQEDPCEVKSIRNGKILKEKTVSVRNWSGVYTGDKIVYESVDVGSSKTSGTSLYVTCGDGYLFQGEENEILGEIICRRGQWTPIPHCQLDHCLVEFIENGEILEQKTDLTKNWLGIVTGENTVYESVVLGSSKTDGSSLYVRCGEGYSFQREENEGLVKIICRRAQWTPTPRCQLANEQIEPGISETNRKTIPVSPTIHSTSETPSITTIGGDQDSSTTVGENDGNDPLRDNRDTKYEEESLSTDATITPTCSCQYVVRENILKAYDGKKILAFGDEIPSGSTVSFYCTDVGLYNLRGQTTVTCPPDCIWHSALFPTCIHANDEDVIIRVRSRPEESMKVAPGGIITIIAGTALTLTCRVKVGPRTPVDWIAPTGSTGFKQQGTSRKTNIYIMYYVLNAVSPDDSGKYICFNHGASRSIEIKVTDVQCPKIEETGEFVVSYSDTERTFQSTANFDCVSPKKRHGPSYVTCEASGLWSEPPPLCQLPTCSIGLLYDHIPEGVVPLIEEDVNEVLPYGYVLKLFCEENGRILKGRSYATCSTDGEWETGRNNRCVQGCPSLVKKSGSELLIYPEKENYFMGDSVILTCPPGKELTEDIERILCFNNGWTPDTLPDCQ